MATSDLLEYVAPSDLLEYMVTSDLLEYMATFDLLEYMATSDLLEYNDFMRLPIGIQDFTHLREEKYLYIDKTMHMMPLLQGGRFFFARPRRFGKSLFLSTFKAAFSGRKDLFAGLWLEDQFDFAPRPVIRLDFSALDYLERSLEMSILEDLRRIAQDYGFELEQNTAKSAFEELIRALSGTVKVVILIDEYDKPITDYLLEPVKRTEHQAVLKSVYGVLKPLDAHIHLVFLTGVSKIGKLSLFSDLNNLQDISLNQKYVQVCGYSRSEIETHLTSWLEAIAVVLNISLPELWEAITFWYNGYSWDGIHKMFCPFSFLLFLENQEFRSFWYETGTPTFLVELVKNAQFNAMQFESIALDEMTISSTNVENLEPISLMFQTGYLTMIGKTRTTLGTRYQLSYPNEEVRQAFSKSLLLEYSQGKSYMGSFSLELQDALLALDWVTFFEVSNKVLAGIPYEIFPKKEAYVHSLMHLMLISTGFQTQSQVQTSLGRMDTLTTTFDYSIIFEFKTAGTAQQAIEQIDSSRYADSLSKPVIKVGVLFDLEQKQISDWAIG